jgi:uncharacterized protein YigE (DUF2233 family)
VKAALAALLACLAAPAFAVTCEDMDWQGASYTVCTVDRATDDLRMFLYDDSGAVLGSFAAIEQATGRPLLFAMNAGMYHPDRRPVGLYIEDGVQIAPLVSSAGPGNFGMLPNGVFCITDSDVLIIETGDYLNDTPPCRYATQSGPMLLMGSELHPRFLPDSTSRHYRNGVGTAFDGKAVFAISNEPVTFHDFATLFRDALDRPNALFLDGAISRLHTPMLGRSDFGVAMGPVVGVVSPP